MLSLFKLITWAYLTGPGRTRKAGLTLQTQMARPPRDLSMISPARVRPG